MAVCLLSQKVAQQLSDTANFALENIAMQGISSLGHSREGFVTCRREVCECLRARSVCTIIKCKLKTELRICSFLYPILLLMH